MDYGLSLKYINNEYIIMRLFDTNHKNNEQINENDLEYEIIKSYFLHLYNFMLNVCKSFEYKELSRWFQQINGSYVFVDMINLIKIGK